MKPAEYWIKRAKVLENASNDYGIRAYRDIENTFVKAQMDIQKEINAWVGRLADNNGMSMVEARKLLNKNELQEFKWDVNTYIKYGRENAIDGRWIKELENASAKFHISRLEALQIRTQHAAERAFGNQLDAIDTMARKVYTENYYHSIFEVQKGFNMGWDIGQIDQRKLDKILSKPWAADGKNFSDRIWSRRDQMVNGLHQELTRTCILGESPDRAIKSMEQYVDSSIKGSKAAAARLVMTEKAYFHAESIREAYKELGVEEFEIVATLDNLTCEKCQPLDGKHFPVSEYHIGITVPPFHPNCRCVTAPYFEDDIIGQRAARDENGKTYYVPDNMTYKEWKDSLVGGHTEKLEPASIATTKLQRNYESELSQKFGKEHYDGMRDLVDACKTDSAVKVWTKYEKDIKVGDAAYRGNAKAQGSTIYVNGIEDAKGSSYEAPYQTSFHESGHAIDYINASKGTGNGLHFSSKYKDGIFPNTIVKEVNDMVNAKAKTIKQAYKEHMSDWEWLFKQGYISESDYNHFKKYGYWISGEPKYSKKLAYKAIEKEIRSLEKLAKADLSDIIEGATGAKIYAGFGHGASYWKKRMWLGVNDGLATEAFAEMIDSTFCCPESLAAIQQYLPESYKIFLEMLDYLANN